MSDIALGIVDNCFDLEIKDDDLVGDDGLETALAISLFTDKRVTDEELPSGHRSKRGWWGDMYPEGDRDQIGSRLWTLDPEKRTLETLRKSEDYSREATKWMIEDGLADAINVLSEYNINNHLVINVDVVKPDGLTSRYAVVWDAQEIRRA